MEKDGPFKNNAISGITGLAWKDVAAICLTVSKILIFSDEKNDRKSMEITDFQPLVRHVLTAKVTKTAE
jgi:hypothetical protein